MAKASGGTRISRDVVGNGTDIGASKSKFNAYNRNEWEHTYFNDSNGGFVVTSLDRKFFGQRNKQEKAKFSKEQRMCRQYADYGFQIEHLQETTGVSSPDTNIVSFGKNNSIIRVNGVMAELKSLSSRNNIRRHATYAINNQGAEIVLFEFTNRAKKPSIINEMSVLSRMGIHGYYYFTGDDKPTRF